MRLDERQKEFVGYLLNLAVEGREDRGGLAELRSGLSKNPGEMAHVHRHIVPYLPENDYNDRWYYLTATLFGLYPKHQNGGSFGSAFRPLREKSDSMEARFIALLNAHADDLDDHLRHGISLLKANECPLDWFKLFEDLLHWDDSEKRVQLRWAKDFYKSRVQSKESASRTNDNCILEREVGDHE